MSNDKRLNLSVTLFLMLALSHWNHSARSEEVHKLDNGTVQVGIDREKGAAICWLSWKTYPKNVVNIADPGRLIQQSYYAGASLDRRDEGQSKFWSPWTWNPIQAGGIGSWALVTTLERTNNETLFSETIPKLWDMPNEEAAAVMRQWTTFEPSMPEVLAVRCEFVSKREVGDRWGKSVLHHQEIPACYFTANFAQAKCYLGNGKWRNEKHPAGPPWGIAEPPRKAMGFFDELGNGIALFSPAANKPWNFGPHGDGLTDNPEGGPCMHVAAIDHVKLEPKSTYRYRYWIVVGSVATIEARLDELWTKYAKDRAELVNE